MNHFEKKIQEISDRIHRAHKDPKIVIAEQLRIPSGVTIAIITNFSMNLMEKIKDGVFDRDDQLELAKEVITFLNYLAENNYLAFLVLTEQFDEIRELFTKEERLKEEVAVALLIEKEKEEEKQKQDIVIGMQQQVSLSEGKKRLEERLHQAEKELITIISLYTQFMKREQEIHIDFYQKQIELFDNAYVDRIKRIDDAINFVLKDDNIAELDRTNLAQLREDYIRERKTIDDMPVYNSDGSINSHSLKVKFEALEKLDKIFRHRFRSLLEQLMKTYPENTNLSKIYLDERNDVDNYQKKLNHNERIHEKELLDNFENLQEKIAGIKPHIEETQIITKKELESSMQKLVGILKNIEVSRFPESQGAEFTRDLNELNRYIKELNRTGNIQQLTNKFAEKLTHLERMCRPNMPLALYQEFKEK